MFELIIVKVVHKKVTNLFDSLRLKSILIVIVCLDYIYMLSNFKSIINEIPISHKNTLNSSVQQAYEFHMFGFLVAFILFPFKPRFASISVISESTSFVFSCRTKVSPLYPRARTKGAKLPSSFHFATFLRRNPG